MSKTAMAGSRIGSWRHRRLGLTFPIVLACLKKQKLTLVLLLVASLLLGVVPTIKAEIEAGVIEQVNECFRNGPDRCDPDETLTRFDRSRDEAGLPEKITYWAFSGISAVSALVAFFIVAAAAMALQWGSYILSTRIDREIFASMRDAAFRSSLSADTHEIESLTNAPGQFSSAIQQGALATAALYTGLIRSGQDVFAIVTVLILLATISPIFAAFCLVMVLAQIGIGIVQARHLKRRRERFDRSRNALLATTDDILGKREIIAAYEQQSRYAAMIDETSRRFARETSRINILESLYQNLSAILTDYGRILVLFAAVAISFWFGRESVGSVGDAYFFASVYIRLLGPSSNLVRRYEDARRSRDTSRQFLLILESGRQEPDSDNSAIGAEWVPGEAIGFLDVTFRYPTGKSLVLNHCSFTVPALRTTLLLGPSGCGKSTIARILLGFWRHDEGRISVGGHDIREFRSTRLRSRMSYVAQGDHIVDATVRENLLWVEQGKTRADEDLKAALHKVGLTHPDTLDWLARDLSLGQQQRLSVARMMLDRSEVVIMDEPVAGVDLDTLTHVSGPLRQLLSSGKHTVLMVSHRLSFASLAHHVVLMSADGRIIEEGSPEFLMQSQTQFRRLFEVARSELISDRDPAL
jgi:ABC-type multidrug transport system fused ATPase/permease subunit